ncbi:hypothetical protein [Edaphobacter sp. 12200R-103]|uniref:hypothetical protein n=1 Tax=Edaphobacter sp. 12200R-103 TaxID=2703788 RepID=UPI00138CA1F9|nr:hypothetical protein [Edaphobacter sp. 12200R-103]QHS52129.1 hypothetical protein GWR55_10575 [Edaphobacter sp. 12200R-103]
MPVPSIIFASLRLRKPSYGFLLALVLGFVTNAAQAKGPDPAERIPLDPLGFQAPQTQFMLAGSSMMTVDFVDPSHLLLTYNAKRLLKRLADCPPGDQDRFVEAVLLELPSGKALARTLWRTHDHGQYLWNLGRGRFMLRIRNTLTTFAPMVNLPHGNAFNQRAFIRTDRRIGGILLSPDADLMILETMDTRDPEVLGDQPDKDDKPVQINFFRLISLAGDDMDVRPAGVLRSRAAGRIPANAAGFIAILDGGRQRWSFNFKSYGGQTKELAGFDSTCRPSPILVSRSEFIAFGCHASHTPQVIGAFNLRGEEMWEQNMSESYVSPSFAYAPGSGRFAISRVLTRASMVEDETVSAEMFDSQAVTVYQTDSGRQLLRVDAAPIARAGQNFDLSPDGMHLAIIRDGSLEVYNLPALTPDERKAVQMAEASAPQIDGDPAMLLSSSGSGPANAGSSAGSSPPTPELPHAADAASSNSGPAQPPPAAPPADAAQPNATGSTAATASQPSGGAASETAAPPTRLGDVQEQHRRPPTLYAPGESHGNDPAHRDDPR